MPMSAWEQVQSSIVIGEVFFKYARNFALKLTSAVVGAIVYFIIRAVVLRLGMNANDMKLLSAIIVAVSLCIPVVTQRIKEKQAYSEEGGED